MSFKIFNLLNKFFFKMSLKVTFQSTKVICFTAYILQTFLYIFSSIVYCH